jgi:hypothetical protein
VKLRISYGCGCGTTVYKMVTDGIIRSINKHKYYRIKLYFNSDDSCEAMCHKSLSCNLETLNLDVGEKFFLQFENFDKLIEVK